MRALFQNITLLAFVALLSIGLGEVVLRLAFDEVNYLMPRLVPHPVLGHVIEPDSGGHDRWGFRNLEVPERTEILAIGDSQTYGVSATADDSWPAQLGKLTGRSVYNLSLGGYGPPDYRYLLERYGVKLEPRVAVIGFYFGNDLARLGDFDGHAVSFPSLHDTRFLGPQRTWLSQHSLFYQVSKFALPQLASLVRRNEIEATGDSDSIAIRDPVSASLLTPVVRLGVIDQSVERNRTGLEATKAALLGIDAICRASRIECLYLLIPTKESVYERVALRELAGDDLKSVTTLVREEDRVRQALVAFLDTNEMAWIDPLLAMRDALERQRLYSATDDGHPIASGYGVIAREVHLRLTGRKGAFPD